ncbi:PREDICTED: transcription initiation factor TFIID subunit 4 isoform X2 [Nicrophorus vespilloides]|uniref:Transcription initiation factor TFIID subunit 4 isoform X2 n=1 Tax=Nicrophorus vespilloides TaxID=110193 RepID=A0ABM1M1S6_NICVS|nr:PREDICTED: transcription initiation factor TFIID subunit 4 isoform X2 [Nicrophorus vespilloides]
MASVKFLEEALSTDVDESAVSAIVGSLENQLVTSAPAAPNQAGNATVLNQNHINSAISNGGTIPSQKHGAIANGDTINSITGVTTAQVATGTLNNATYNTTVNNSDGNKSTEPVNIVYSQGSQAMTSTGTIISNRVSFPAAQNVQNGTIGLSQLAPQTVLQTSSTSNVQTIQAKQPTLVIKTSAAGGSAQGLVTVPMNVTTNVSQVNNQLTLQSLQGLQPGQQGHLLLKTENGQYQLLRVGPAPTGGVSIAGTTGGQPVSFRMQTVPAQSAAAAAAATTTPATISTTGATQQVTAAAPTVVNTTPVQRPANDNTKEKCRKFLANLLELSSREPKSVEKNVRMLIQDLIDAKVEPEDFCDRLERLLNASPQPCLIGFLKKSLPLLRQSLATKELTIEGIRPPPTNVVYSLASGTPTIQTQVRPALAASQVRLVAPGTTVVRPGLVQQRVVTPLRGAIQQTRMLTTIRQPNANQQVIVSSSQPPALHPVFPSNQVMRTASGLNIVRQPIQVKAGTLTQTRPQMQIRTTYPVVTKNLVTNIKMTGTKPVVPSNISKLATKDKEKKTFSSAYTGDDDINDVAAMGGVNLAEETQRILGSTEFVGTQIRSCKEEFFLNMNALQHRIRLAVAKHGLDEPSNEVAAVISHAAQERVKNLVEKLAIITEHRLEMVKSDPRYEVTSDIKGQLKFLEELDRAERKRHEEMEREMLLRAAKSRSKTEDPEQAKLKAKAKEMQRVEMEELRQREANATALQAIGPRKKPRLDGDAGVGTSQANTVFNSGARGQLPLKQRMKKVTLRDLQFLFETEKDLCKSTLLYKSYLK